MRDKRIDFIKGMLMLCVIYGHTINALLGGTHHPPVCLHVFVRTFDMPFFMILSGYFLKRSFEKRNAMDVVLNRLSMIGVPIAIWTLLRGYINIFAMYYFLWAVMVSGLIYIVIRKVSSLLPCRCVKTVEFFLYTIVTISLYVVKVPWNMFYLFPFFVFGNYIQDLGFKLKRWEMGGILVLFVVALCFWQTAYTPWRTGAFAWKDDYWAILIYAYRFALGVVGVFVMSRAFELIREHLTGTPFVVRTITECGTETLALYILQSIIIERILRSACDIAWTHYPVVLPQSVVNLVGYVIAPVLSFVSIVGLLYVIRCIKRTYILKYAFGFRIK